MTLLHNPEAIFPVANTLALPGWLWLAVWLYLPTPAKQATRYLGLALPIVFGVLYAATMSVHFSAAEGDFSSLPGVQSLFDASGATLGGWIHYLAFDLFVGWCITQHASNRSMPSILVVLCLGFTLVLGPVGLLLYCACRVSHCAVRLATNNARSTTVLWKQILGGQPALAQCGVFLILTLPVFTLALLMDQRTVLDTNVWLKPIKFCLALTTYTLTLSWYTAHLPLTWRDHPRFRQFSVIVVIAILLEMLWLVFAATVGEASHFNQTHPLLAPIYFAMGLVAVILTSYTFVLGVGFLRNPVESLSTLTRFSLSYSLLATFVLTLLTAGYLASAPAQSHAVWPDDTGQASVQHALPLLGWLRSAGDLRVAHFFATHAMHFIPLACWLLGRSIRQTQDLTQARASGKLALAISALYSLGVLFVFLQALFGKPFV